MNEMNAEKPHWICKHEEKKGPYVAIIWYFDVIPIKRQRLLNNAYLLYARFTKKKIPCSNNSFSYQSSLLSWQGKPCRKKTITKKMFFSQLYLVIRPANCHSFYLAKMLVTSTFFEVQQKPPNRCRIGFFLFHDSIRIPYASNRKAKILLQDTKRQFAIVKFPTDPLVDYGAEL